MMIMITIDILKFLHPSF